MYCEVLQACPIGVALMPTARSEDAVGWSVLWLVLNVGIIFYTPQSRSEVVSRLPLVQIAPSGSPASKVA